MVLGHLHVGILFSWGSLRRLRFDTTLNRTILAALRIIQFYGAHLFDFQFWQLELQSCHIILQLLRFSNQNIPLSFGCVALILSFFDILENSTDLFLQLGSVVFSLCFFRMSLNRVYNCLIVTHLRNNMVDMALEHSEGFCELAAWLRMFSHEILYVLYWWWAMIQKLHKQCLIFEHFLHFCRFMQIGRMRVV